ncbi:MAG: right-handed parallel beta-helix repeat-containing protein [Candidatus Lokiarchaeota archaeon]|nr:right-handed parallel beta-helix repeat-containing protein [Candidatus Lokiarchaeota archaeon]
MITYKKKISAPILSFLVLLLIIPLFSTKSHLAESSSNVGCYVGGSISSSTTWDISNSPYYVASDLTVEPNIRLTIDSGVQVLFTGDYSVNVKGELHAIGTFDNPIIFTSDFSNPEKGDWEAINFQSNNLSQKSELEYVEFSYGENGVLLNNDLVNVSNCVFEYNTNGIYVNFWESSDITVIFSNNTFRFNDYGINFYRFGFSYLTLLFEHNQVYENSEDGIYFWEGKSRSNWNFTNNQIFNNSKNGINFRSLYDMYSQINIFHNEIHHNGVNGIFLDYLLEWYNYDNSFKIQHNNIFNNTQYNIECTYEYPSIIINAAKNWWGTTDAEIIQSKIRDHDDDSSFSYVEYYPYLYSRLIFNEHPKQIPGFNAWNLITVLILVITSIGLKYKRKNQ